jgi:OOP family OmpA-OmpF porin
MRRAAAILSGLLLAGAAGAAELPLPPGAVLSAEEASPFAMVSLPAAPWSDGPPASVEAEGALTRRAWRAPADGRTPDQLLAPIREALVAEGFSVLYTCADRACGGYDFRFGLDLLPAPAMYVDLGNYRYLLAQAEGDSGRLTSVVTSTGLGFAYVHVTTVEPGAVPAAQPAAEPAAEAPPPVAVAPSDMAERLLADGHVVLDGLEFPSGSASLPEDRYESLAALGAFMEANPSARIMLVGHTDAVGAPDANVALSRARAQAVRTRLIGAYGTEPGRVLAEGAGYLAPVASNATPEGRAANRRVEAVLLAAP